MLRLLPKALAAVAVLGAGAAWAQVDADVNAATQAEPPEAASGADELDDALPAPPADAGADADADIAPRARVRGDADLDANTDLDADRPGARTDADANLDADVDADRPRARLRGNADADLNTDRPRARVRGDADADLNADRPRARIRGNADRPRANARGDADVNARGDANVDLSRKPALGVSFRNQGDALVISRVFPNSPAARMGLRPGDRIVSLNGTQFDSNDAFVDAAGQVVLDEDADIVYLRDGQTLNGTVRFMPWSTVYVDDADDLGDFDEDDVPRRVGRPMLDDDALEGTPDDLEDAVEDSNGVIDTIPRTAPDADDVEDGIEDAIDD